jgi:hypothetical protein
MHIRSPESPEIHKTINTRANEKVKEEWYDCRRYSYSRRPMLHARRHSTYLSGNRTCSYAPTAATLRRLRTSATARSTSSSAPTALLPCLYPTPLLHPAMPEFRLQAERKALLPLHTCRGGWGREMADKTGPNRRAVGEYAHATDAAAAVHMYWCAAVGERVDGPWEVAVGALNRQRLLNLVLGNVVLVLDHGDRDAEPHRQCCGRPTDVNLPTRRTHIERNTQHAHDVRRRECERHLADADCRSAQPARAL